MLAIPIFRSRVAPVLNWCSRVLLLPQEATDSTSGREIVFSQTMGPFERLKLLREQGVTSLICGALSPELLRYAEYLGISVIWGVAGEVHEVLRAYQERQLDQPCFWLPGCRHRRRYRNGVYDSNRGDEDMAGRAGGKGRGSGRYGRGGGYGRGMRLDGTGAGAGGYCVCSNCGATVRHERSIPCAQMRCHQCGQPMARQR